MAGAGYKLFVSGDVLTAAQVNTYLNEQTVMVFATSAARTSALSAVLAEGMMSYLQDSNTVYYYDGSAWNALASGDITAITAGNGISVTSGTGPVPTVAIDTTVTVDKTTAQTLTNKTLTSPALTTPTISTLTTNGDVLYGTGSGALSRLGIGSTGNVLTVASGLPTWAAPSGGGGMTLINSGGTTLGAGTTTISSIPGTYKNLQIIVRAARPTTIDVLFEVRLNGDSSAYYNNWTYSNTAGYSNVNFISNGTEFRLQYNGLSNDADCQYNSLRINLYDYANSATFKIGDSLMAFKQAAGGVATNYALVPYSMCYASATAISSISFFTNSGGFSAGTVYVYGEN